MNDINKEVGLLYFKLIKTLAEDFSISIDAAASITARVLHWYTMDEG